MGGKWSVIARNHKDGVWQFADYSNNFMRFIIKGIYCLIKYEVVILEKHG